jgi:hypothetical protein
MTAQAFSNGIADIFILMKSNSGISIDESIHSSNLKPQMLA